LNGNYSLPFSCLHDVPYNMTEWGMFAHKNLYKQVSFDHVIDEIINNYESEKFVFANISKHKNINVH